MKAARLWRAAFCFAGCPPQRERQPNPGAPVHCPGWEEFGTGHAREIGVVRRGNVCLVYTFGMDQRDNRAEIQLPDAIVDETGHGRPWHAMYTGNLFLRVFRGDPDLRGDMVRAVPLLPPF